MLVGIDPGISGALVAVTANGIADWLLMPTMVVGSKKRVNPAAVAAWLRDIKPDHVVIERVGAMPGQGTASMFSFGHSAGVLEGVVAALGLPYTLATPQQWKGAAALIGANKDASRTRALQLWPDVRELHAKAKGQALADAALIAQFGLKAMGERE